ncbi:MAG: hypothetical protein HW392_2090 [Steroidobacteraceae bacterium]|nr:hypothetical protein [Steroidobacteraceae bacterium]
MPDMREQLRNNLVALISLVIALSALGYNTWRNELTERNRNIRAAGELRAVRQADSAGLAEDDEAIDALRQTTLESLRALN